MLEEYRIDHVETGTKRIVCFPFSAPRIQSEWTVPFEQAKSNSDDGGTTDDTDPNPAVEGLHEGVERSTSLLFLHDDGKAGIKIRIGEVDDTAASLRKRQAKKGTSNLNKFE